MRDGVQEGVLPLVAADLAHQEDGVKDYARDQQGEEDNAQDHVGDARLIQDDPADVKRDRKSRQQHAKRDEGRDGAAAAVDVHQEISLQRGRGPPGGGGAPECILTAA